MAWFCRLESLSDFQYDSSVKMTSPLVTQNVQQVILDVLEAQLTLGSTMINIFISYSIVLKFLLASLTESNSINYTVEKTVIYTL